jgi:hypothetical protein
MSKYVIELDDTVKAVQKIAVTDGGRIYTHKWEVEDLEELTADYVNEHFGVLQDDAYNAGFERGKKEAYQKGFEDGKWKSEDGCTGCKWEGKTGEHLPCDYCMNNFTNQWTSDKIEVGDEVLWDGEKHIVTYINRDIDAVKFNNGDMDLVEVKDYDLMSEDGSVIDHVSKHCLTKTGRHFDIKGILEAIHG